MVPKLYLFCHKPKLSKTQNCKSYMNSNNLSQLYSREHSFTNMEAKKGSSYPSENFYVKHLRMNFMVECFS